MTVTERATLTSRAAMASAAVATGLLVLKGYAAVATGSAAMLGSLADTALDLLASLITLFGVRHAAQPADHDHRFGHGKAEALAALAQVFLIAMSSVGIVYHSVERLIAGVVTHDAELGIAVSIAAIVATAALLAYQKRVIALTGSLAIGTDHLHYRSDVALNVAVIAALALDRLLGIRGIDALFGIAIALWLLWSAWSASGEAIDQLMDREWPPAKRERFLALTRAHPQLAGIHDLRTRTSGTHDFVQFHVWLARDMTITQAHEVMDEIEAIIHREFPAVEVLIHPDPEGHVDRGEVPGAPL